MRGLTIARPIRVEKATSIGKEVIVDPTDTDEGLTAEMLSAATSIEYVDPGEELDNLRARVSAAGIRAVSKRARLSRRLVQEFVSAGTVPQKGTIAILEAALREIEEKGRAELRRGRAPS